jgi:hypothetical protein
MKQSTETEVQTTIAAEYVAIRWEIEKHQARRRELEPMVQEWCATQISQDKGNKKVAYICPSSKAQLVLRTVEDKDFIKNHPDIQCLDELIQLQVEAAVYQNKQAIASLVEQVEQLQKQIAQLSLTDTGRDLVFEREELMKELRKSPQYFKKQIAFQVK